MIKKDIRKNTLSKMKSFDKTKKVHADNWLKQQLFNDNWYKNSNRIGIVLSMPHEVDTYQIIKAALLDNKRMFVPNTNYESKDMNFKEIKNLSCIEKDEKGIYFVNEDTETTDQLDLIIVPGVAFREDCYRVGYGGGYYDRFLSHSTAHTLSLIYDFQLTQFDIENHDQPVDKLIIYNT
ncbi:5-formyltetrahydrofolate cyclo-ligase [Staphylococcus taiwanensis]|nr:5-formyltetrahydrofolate cyclo-ligase [Staphylococcus taiwanensis]